MYNNINEEQKRKAPHRNEEIDLRLVMDKVGQGFNSLAFKIENIIKLALRNAFVVLIFVILCLGIGYAYFKTERPFYKSSMTVMLNEIRNEFVEDQLNRLTFLVNDGNYPVLASRLEITPEAAAQIRSFRFSNLDIDKIEDDSVLTGSPFRIELTLYDNELFSSLEPALTNYLENNQFFSKQKQIREIQTRKMISKLRNDINSIDSVRALIVEPKGPVNGFIFGEALDPTNLYRESIVMYREQVRLESDLDRLDHLEVVNGFVPRIKPSGPKLLIYLIVAGMLGLFLGLVAANELEKRRRGI